MEIVKGERYECTFAYSDHFIVGNVYKCDKDDFLLGNGNYIIPVGLSKFKHITTMQQPTKEQVLEAYNDREKLKELFPEAFKKDMHRIEPFKINYTNDLQKLIWIGDNVASEQGLALKCFGLNKDYDWKLGLSDTGEIQILIPTPKP